jgi:hypothetical protein
MEDDAVRFPTGSTDEKELLLQWLDYLRGAVRRNLDGLDDAQARWSPDLTLEAALTAYRERATATNAGIRSLDLTRSSDPDSWGEGNDLRWVVLHLINETARHAGHADATRELLDGTTGE